MSHIGTFMAPSAAVFLIFAVVFPVWVGIVHSIQVTRTAALRREGLDTTGEATRLWSSGSDRSKTPMMSYAFTIDGAAYTGECSVPDAIRAEFRQGRRLPIRYLASNPAINHPAAWDDESTLSGRQALLVATPAALLGIVFLTQLLRQRRLVAEGVPTAGVVARCYRSGRSWAVDYQFHTNDGNLAKGTSKGNAAVGTPICVLYLSREPRRNRSYPVPGYRVVQ
jgi:hypothetical protein